MDSYDNSSWLTEMGLDSSMVMEQCEFMDSFDEDMAAMLGHDFDFDFDNNNNNNNNNSSSSSTLVNIPSTNSISSLCNSPPPPPPKLHKPNNYSNFPPIPIPNPNSTPLILNFAGAAENQVSGEEPAVTEPPEDQLKRAPPAKKPSRVRPPSQTYDHIIAERKRREQLSQRFVALSTIVPGLKKMDKTSVLGDAIKYLKHLQERVKTLEEQATKQTMESVVLVKKSQVTAEDDGEGSSSDEKSSCSDELPLPEIEARVCKNHILLRVHCEKQRGILVNLLTKVESLNLAVVNTNVTPFGTFALDITIVAEMEKEFNLTVKEVVKRLRGAF
ncbi:transcription factor bHLH18-like isoform X2 [Andrographis paniculata]|uniref:transcription factor bHLH18-like isoform X2 n=1 Tax=Andrographis paniculata TaxID=175694 RepID=UPI0021E7F94D|nr:transcription factor bHLH18-like isoform X2 [Andrographis paniculata]